MNQFFLGLLENTSLILFNTTQVYKKFEPKSRDEKYRSWKDLSNNVLLKKLQGF